MANTFATVPATSYNKHDYVMRMRARVNKPSTWKDVLNVKISDVRTIVNAYMSTEPSVVTGTRGTAYNYEDFTVTPDQLVISLTKMIPMFIDEADRIQQSWVDQMGIADFQGKKIDEKIEALTLAKHGDWTDFGVTDLSNTGADDTTQITVSAANIDDIIRAVKRKLYTNNGVEFAVEKGIFFVWRPEDFELLEAFVQANGFTEADISLKNGIPVQKAFRYMGVDHYLSTQHTANHVFCGIKRMYEIGILRGTFGSVKFIEDPASGTGAAASSSLSGLGIVSRLDYGFNNPTQLAEFFIDLNVV